ncbi:DUF2989 domain-containing protein [Shewanella sp. C32]|uniref:DUF2989 domain-containing protein n=1 Tax=Shewanella electrica TaxID=515560 RepID=A0ABT2FPX5_9GAMM|nr:DUF2989 domain-containing protein [Shewanella electrica]MCH1925861.1 DUF2989 domain-containing protein [Shewanella electrica]MCS4557254.1 DUF2989 domain-containing protein [Shewanella electrica]
MAKSNSVAKLGVGAASVVGLLLLAGCGGKSPLAEICHDNPQVCRDLDLDATCRERRTPLLELRLAIKRQQVSADDETQFKLLQALESYNTCLKRAAGIQHVNNPSLTSNAQRAYALTSESLQALQQQTQGRDNAHLAYYHWTKLSDRSALEVLNTLQQQHKIQDAYILAGLGTERLRSEPEQARELFLQALQNATPEQFVADWLLALASVTPDVELKYLLQKTNVVLTDRGVNQRMLTDSLGARRAAQAGLDTEAQQLAQALQRGEYQQSHWPDRLAYTEPVAQAPVAASTDNASVSGAVTSPTTR